MFLPCLVIIGRTNVGKSTLFNRLTRSRVALVANQPGVTRDRNYGRGEQDGQPYLLVDTGGFEPDSRSGIVQQMMLQVQAAIADADVLLLMVDARSGQVPEDQRIVAYLRSQGHRPILVVNKAEGMQEATAAADFFNLGCGRPYVISASHGQGVGGLITNALEAAYSTTLSCHSHDPDGRSDIENIPRIAIVGRPNVGKSTLANALLGADRVIAFDEPGTTRDTIALELTCYGRDYILLDTAGLRRKSRVDADLEKFSVIRTLHALEEADCAILMVDACQGIAEQDAHIASYCIERGCAITIAINKWDQADAYRREQVLSECKRKLVFLDFAKTHPISAQKKQGLSVLLRSVGKAIDNSSRSLPTPQVTRVLQQAVQQQPPPRVGRIRPKLRYAHQGGQRPPTIIVHGNALHQVPASYTRYLEHCFRKAFALQGALVRVQYRSNTNPFA